MGETSHRQAYLDRQGQVKYHGGFNSYRPMSKSRYRFAQPHKAESHRVIEVTLQQAKSGVPIEEKLRKITVNANLSLTKRKPQKSDPELAFRRHLDDTID